MNTHTNKVTQSDVSIYTHIVF